MSKETTRCFRLLVSHRSGYADLCEWDVRGDPRAAGGLSSSVCHTLFYSDDVVICGDDLESLTHSSSRLIDKESDVDAAEYQTATDRF
jgi:hypothetical protein